MGLDLALGVIILIAAFRGWFKGFVSQAVHLVALVCAVYASVRVRDQAKPYVLPYLTSIQPELVDRILWWVSAVVTYLVLVGLTLLIIKMTRRPEIPGISQSGRNDQFAGFFLGGLKGLLVAAFVSAGIQNYAMEQLKNVSWGEDQVKASWALKWNEAYRPAQKIWASKPVRHFVSYVHRMGLDRPGDPSAIESDDEPAEEDPVRTASRPSEAGATAPHRSSSSTPPPSEAAEPAGERGPAPPQEVEKSGVDNAN